MRSHSIPADVPDVEKADGADNDNIAGDDGNGVQESEEEAVANHEKQEPIVERESAQEMLAKFRAKQQQEHGEVNVAAWHLGSWLVMVVHPAQ